MLFSPLEEETMTLFILAHGCPNCRGAIDDNRLTKGFPCEACLPRADSGVCESLKKSGKLKSLSVYCQARDLAQNFEAQFVRALKSPPSRIQLSWALRLYLGESFAIVAPTGVGKTTFGLMASLLEPGKVLILVPTRLLADQLGGRLEKMAQAAGLRRQILIYRSRKAERQRLETGNFDILVATTAFFYRRFAALSAFSFRLIFIDDVDSFLKQSSQVDLLFKLLGFNEEEIALAVKLRLTAEEERRLEEARRRLRDRTLIVSSATLRPRTNRLLLFRRLLGFEIQRATTTLRRIEDTYLEFPSYERALKKVPNLVHNLGGGGLLFLAGDLGREAVEEAASYLRNQGLSVLSYLELSPERLYEEMSRGDFHLALGLAHPTNPLVRGIDLPQVLRYVLFLGVPKYLIPTSLTLAPRMLLLVLQALMPLLEDKERSQALADIIYLRRYQGVKEEALERYPRLKERFTAIRNRLSDLLKDEEFLSRLRQSPEVFLEERDGELFLIVADTTSYLQASGRVSRLTVAGLTQGLSVILSWEPRALTSLKRRLRLLGQEVTLKPFESVDLERLLEIIDKSRQAISSSGAPDLFRTTLVVVESPHKARTIASFFGRPTARRIRESLAYEIPLEDRILVVTASLGHLVNLSRLKGIFGVIKEGNRFLPIYDTIKICRTTGEELIDPEETKDCPPGELWDKADLVAGLQHLAFCADEVLVASDPDAEGEKIAYDLQAFLRPFQKNIYRLEFHEVTPRALREALKSPGQFKISRVKAQLTRRLLDRWVGFGLSRQLWKTFGRRGLSAGRVQSPVLGWIIERALEARQKKARLEYLLGDRRQVLEIEDISLAKRLFETLPAAKIQVLERGQEFKHPLPPFTTDLILEEANRRLRFSARQTMALLQELFETGLITYHRTDSTRVSEYGRLQVARPYIVETLGEEFFYPRGFSEEGAHEAIRPTRPEPSERLRLLLAAGLLELKDPEAALSLYDLIFRRFMASQMRPSEVEVARLRFELEGFSWEESVVTKVLRPGFEQLWPTFFPLKGDDFRLHPLKFRLVPRKPPFSQGSLIREMKERGLGRPSTYAEIVNTLLARGYIVERRGLLFPTALGKRIYRFLKEHYPHLTDEELTRQVEAAMDHIEAGELSWQEVVREAYQRLRPLLEAVGDHSKT